MRPDHAAVIFTISASLAIFACSDDVPRPAADAASDSDAPDVAPVDSGSSDAEMDGGEDSSAADATSDGGDSDASMDAEVRDSGPPDAGPRDTGLADTGSPDSGLPDSGAPDTSVPPRSDHHIHIEVDNFCRMTVTPTEITIPAGQTAYFDWHNHSVDYQVDVWMSYGGGYLDLERGRTWDEPIGHCIGPRVGDEYADVSTACSNHRFLIHCN